MRLSRLVFLLILLFLGFDNRARFFIKLPLDNFPFFSDSYPYVVSWNNITSSMPIDDGVCTLCNSTTKSVEVSSVTVSTPKISSEAVPTPVILTEAVPTSTILFESVPTHRISSEAVPVCEVQRDGDNQYDLVLFTTEDAWNERIQRKIWRWRDMVELYHQYYSFQAVFFTSNRNIRRVFANTSVRIVTEFELNKFQLPVITSMFLNVSEMYNASYYGYLNADILLNYKVFDAMKFIQQCVKNGSVYPQHELAGRVFEQHYNLIPSRFPDLFTLKKYMNGKSYHKKLRNENSADYFIFSQEALPLVTNTSHKIVIGRRKVDNYLMGLLKKLKKRKKVDLIDTTESLMSFHIGKDGFLNRKRRQTPKNVYYNTIVLKRLKLPYGFLWEKGNKRLTYKNKKFRISQIK